MDGSYVKVSTISLLFCFGLGVFVFSGSEVGFNNLNFDIVLTLRLRELDIYILKYIVDLTT